MKKSRRTFIKKSAGVAAALTAGGVLPSFSAKSYSSVMGANDRINVAVMGVHSRGLALAKNFARQPDCEVLHISDVDSKSAARCVEAVKEIQGKAPENTPDFRKTLEDKDVEVLVVATPDHWHAPAGILAVKAGKHVYLEKPASHNPREGELLIEASEKYEKLIQLGTQRRSYPNVRTAMEKLHGGIIGRVYFARSWYANNRPSIGHGKEVPVPGWLDYDLWQGPAPRRPYKDNVIHYNWHWFWHWGTGEALNNGTHMIDLMRWGLGVTYPTRVTSAGGRYRFDDDWETPDTQTITLEFGDKGMMEWVSRSCNPKPEEGVGVGTVFYGENGSMLIDGNSYKIYDLNNEVTEEVKNDYVVNTANLRDPSKNLDAIHIQNLFAAIRKGEKLHSDITEGHRSTLLCQLGNIAWRTGTTLETDPQNGHILNNERAAKLWGREYEPGWEPVV